MINKIIKWFKRNEHISKDNLVVGSYIQLWGKNTHVRCTNCMNFRLNIKNISYCEFEDKCDMRNSEDTMPLKFRPYFKPAYYDSDE